MRLKDIPTTTQSEADEPKIHTDLLAALQYFSWSTKKDTFYGKLNLLCTASEVVIFKTHVQSLVSGYRAGLQKDEILGVINSLLARGEWSNNWGIAKFYLQKLSQTLIDPIAEDISQQRLFSVSAGFNFLVNLCDSNSSSRKKIQKTFTTLISHLLREVTVKDQDQLTAKDRELESEGITQILKITRQLRIVAGVVEYASGVDRKAIHEKMVELLGDADNHVGIESEYIASLLSRYSSATHREADFFLKSIAKRYGIPWHTMKDYKQDWIANAGRSTLVRRTAFKNTLVALQEFSMTYPDFSRLMDENYGLVNFGRYPTQALDDMYQDLKKRMEARGRGEYVQPEDYVVAFFPKSDWNGAFSNVHAVLRALYRSLQAEPEYVESFYDEEPIERPAKLSKKYALKFVEVSSLSDLLLKATKMKLEFGSASGAIVAGHGSIKDIQFGKGEYVGIEELFGNDDPENKQTSRVLKRGLSRFFKGKPSIVFISCSVGKSRGLIQKLSKRFPWLRLIAANTPTNIQEISANEDSNGQLVLDAKYNDGKSKLFEQGVHRSRQ